MVRNANLLRLALRNVIENAVEASPANTDVQIDIFRRENNAEFEIMDHGPGIDPAELEKVRGRFNRGQGSKDGGSGLGLAIVDMAMKKLGGELSFKRVPDGYVVVLSVRFESPINEPV